MEEIAALASAAAIAGVRARVRLWCEWRGDLLRAGRGDENGKGAGRNEEGFVFVMIVR